MSDPGRRGDDQGVADEAVDGLDDLLAPDDRSAAGADMAADTDD